MKLYDWLEAENLTMAVFAVKVGVTHSAVSRWCSGDVFPPGDKLVAIRDATDGKVSADDFMPPFSSSSQAAD